MTLLRILLTLSLSACHAVVANATQSARMFPKDFLFGASTASYQIEGSWNVDGKGENIWDHLTHSTPSPIMDNSTGDVACDSYHNYKRDVVMMRELGLSVYRFSLSWSRILPTGFPNNINRHGISYYNNLINEMLKYNIEPMVTMYHWDLPQPLQDLGGFANNQIAQWYEDYAHIVFENFGDRVKLWVTFNEPQQICYQGYGSSEAAPALNSTGIGDYICTKNILLAHARAYHVYNHQYRASQDGRIGIIISVDWYASYTHSEEDKFAAKLRRQAQYGLYAEPIFGEEGGFPKELSKQIAEKSKKQGFFRSRLPKLSDKEKEFIRGSADFFGVNHYTSMLISAVDNLGLHAIPSVLDDINCGEIISKEWPLSSASWLSLAPNSLYNAMIYLHNKYRNTVFYVTENGWSTDGGRDDDDRVQYYRAALENVLDILEAGVQLRGYMVWSLMDNMEWKHGYGNCYGLYEVDFESPARTRTPRKSAFVYKHIIKSRMINHENCYGLYEVDFESPARTRTPRKSAFVYKHIIKSRMINHEYVPDTAAIMTIEKGH